MVGGGSEQLLGADIGAAQASGEGEARAAKAVPAPAFCMPSLLAMSPKSLVLAAVVQHEVIHAHASLIHQARADGAASS